MTHKSGMKLWISSKHPLSRSNRIALERDGWSPDTPAFGFGRGSAFGDRGKARIVSERARERGRRRRRMARIEDDGETLTCTVREGGLDDEGQHGLMLVRES